MSDATPPQLAALSFVGDITSCLLLFIPTTTFLIATRIPGDYLLYDRRDWTAQGVYYRAQKKKPQSRATSGSHLVLSAGFSVRDGGQTPPPSPAWHARFSRDDVYMADHADVSCPCPVVSPGAATLVRGQCRSIPGATTRLCWQSIKLRCHLHPCLSRDASGQMGC